MTREFIAEVGINNKYAIKCSFRELRSHVNQLKKMNIHYDWQRYELCKKLYDEFKENYPGDLK